MSEYNAAIVFFVNSEDAKEKDELLENLSQIKDVDVLDIYNDGEDWNVECNVTTTSKATSKIDDAIHKKLLDMLPDSCWDYHYIKGIDNDFYWCP